MFEIALLWCLKLHLCSNLGIESSCESWSGVLQPGGLEELGPESCCGKEMLAKLCWNLGIALPCSSFSSVKSYKYTLYCR